VLPIKGPVVGTRTHVVPAEDDQAVPLAHERIQSVAWWPTSTDRMAARACSRVDGVGELVDQDVLGGVAVAG
jgi:hypothetical protein